MANAEQNNRRTPSSRKSRMRADAKRRAARLRRRAERKDIENVPPRSIKGWND